jgi:hypothetical protein
MIFSLFWDFTQRRLVVCYRRFGKYTLSQNVYNTLSIKIAEEARSHWLCWLKPEISYIGIFYFLLLAKEISPALRDVRFDNFRTVLADVLPQNWSWRRNKRYAVSLLNVLLCCCLYTVWKHRESCRQYWEIHLKWDAMLIKAYSFQFRISVL